MAPLTNASARIVDPVLSQFARGYTQSDFIGRILFPRAYVPVRGFKTIRFGKEGFKRFNTRRAPGAVTKRIDFGYESDPAKLYQHALDASVPREHIQEAEAIPGIDLQQEAVQLVLDVMTLDEEIAQATLATTTANYAADNKETLAGNDQWNDPDSVPKDIIKHGKEVIRQKIGREPNILALSPGAFSSLDDHPKLLEKLKYTTSDSITTAMLATYFGVEKVVVGKAIWADDADVFHDVWDNCAVLAYSPQAAASNVRRPSYGYTYSLAGHPFVEQTRWDADSKSWINGVTDERSAELVGADAGFLISAVNLVE